MAEQVALGIKTPDMMQSLGSIMNVANGANTYALGQQSLQSNAMKLQGETQANSDRIAANQFMQDPSNWQNDDGTINLTKANNLVKIAPQSGPAVVQHLSELSNAQTVATRAKMAMTGDQRGVIGQLYGAMGRAGVDDPTVVAQGLDKIKAQYGPDSPMSAYVDAEKMGLSKTPAGKGVVMKSLITQSQSLMSPAEQQSALSPTASLTNTGGSLTPVISTPSVGGNAPSVAAAPGGSLTNTLPPTATKMVNGQPQYVGQVAGAQTGAAPIASGPAIGQTEGITGPVAANNAHYAGVVADASQSANRVSQVQNILQQIPSANMGHGDAGDLLRYFSRLWGGDAATSNDIMAKNLAMLAQKAGNTDAARSFGEMGTPNYKVTDAAGKEAAYSLIGIDQKNQAAGAYFAGTPTNSPDYTNKMVMWNKYADPRAFEFAAKTPSEQAASKAEMIKSGAWKTLQNKMIHLHSMGVDPQ